MKQAKRIAAVLLAVLLLASLAACSKSWPGKLPAVYVNGKVYPVTADENGVAVLGKRVQTPQTDVYYNPYNGEKYCAISKKTLETVFAVQDIDYDYYYRDNRYPRKSLFQFGTEWKSVYLIGTIWQGDIVVTGLMVDGVRY